MNQRWYAILEIKLQVINMKVIHIVHLHQIISIYKYTKW